ncbi:MAG: copper-binding protein [Pseudomonadota bacterium]
MKYPLARVARAATFANPVVMVAALIMASIALGPARPANAEGFLAGRLERLPDIEVGLGNAGYGVSDHKYELTTGKGYRVWIKSTGAKECAFVAPEFFRNVWFRKIEVNKVEIKIDFIHELEFEREGEVELFFTPIKPGTYEWACEGFEEKGMTGKIVVK